MLKNHFRTAWRNLTRNKVFSFINIFGLALGLTCALLILLWVRDERSFDGFHQHKDRLYTLIVHEKEKDGSIKHSMASTPGLLSDALKQQVPEVEYAAMVVWSDDMFCRVDDKTTKEKGRYVGPDFFKLFSFPLLQGDPARALASSDNIVITRRLARSFFRDGDPMGKTIRIDNKRNYIVTGVAADPPENSSIAFDFLLPIEHCFEDNKWMVAGWDHFGPPTYVLLRQNADSARVGAKIRHFLAQQDPVLQDKLLSLQLFREAYLHSHFTGGVPDGGRIDYVRLFSIVAIFVLLISCINFINLATARSAKRSREVGVRKAVGALRGMLFRQFMMEAILTVFIAVLLSLCFTWLLLPFFNRLTNKEIALHPDIPSIAVLFCTILFTGVVAGSYPALYLSSLKPVSVLKGTLQSGPGNTLLRKGLVTFQFALSIILILCTTVVNRQMSYIQAKNLGLDRENVIDCWMQGKLVTAFSSFKNELERSGAIEAMTLSSSNPLHVNSYSHNIQWKGKLPDDKTLMAEMNVDYDFLRTMKMQLLAGRDFSPAYVSDTANFIVNETAVKLMKLQDPVGSPFSHGKTGGRIIGVVKDFHLSSLHDPIPPLFISLQQGLTQGVALIRARPGRTKEALAAIENAYKKFDPLTPFDYSFSDEEFLQQYRSESMVEKLANGFAVLAIAISCLGLFGLMLFLAEQRTREIGIRKVLGAGVPGIIALISGDFLKLVGIAALIASPIGWYIMHTWLQGYAYKISISIWLFLETALLAMLIALLTVGYQAVRAAIANPVKTLRSE